MGRTTTARLVRTVPLSADVSALTFETAGARFVGLDAGAHVDLHLPGGLVRQYSLTDWDDAGSWLSVAVKREPDGRGGSLAAHALRAGDALEVGGPRTAFRLVRSDAPVVLLGGGIGITPLYAMARVLQAEGRPFDLHYLVRSRAHAAFAPALEALGLGERYRLHRDDVDGVPDVADLLAGYPAEAHVYVCGPEVVLTAVLKASEERGRWTVFSERFGSFPPDAEEGADRPFDVVLGSTGRELAVPAGTSLLQVLRDAGVDVDFSCAEGVCGSCITDVLDGDIDHRDSVLTEEERRAGDCMTPCVSRARGARLVLDL